MKRNKLEIWEEDFKKCYHCGWYRCLCNGEGLPKKWELSSVGIKSESRKRLRWTFAPKKKRK